MTELTVAANRMSRWIDPLQPKTLNDEQRDVIRVRRRCKIIVTAETSCIIKSEKSMTLWRK